MFRPIQPAKKHSENACLSASQSVGAFLSMSRSCLETAPLEESQGCSFFPAPSLNYSRYRVLGLAVLFLA